jgi:hypothetical protein
MYMNTSAMYVDVTRGESYGMCPTDRSAWVTDAGFRR